MSRGFSALAIETSTEVCSVAACAQDRVSFREYASARNGSRDIFELIRETLEEVGQSLPSLDCIAFGCGPGGFTGLRVGAAVAQSLAFGASLPVVRVSSLALIAVGAMRKHGASLIAPCLDARMGEAYFAIYRAADGLPRLEVDDCLVDPKKFQLEAGEPFFAAGPGWGAYPEFAERNTSRISGRDPGLVPSAQDLLTVARQRFYSGGIIPAEEALPNYIRDKVTQ
jgi:tRNA threonylcarbamoyladenosine biosynthesis protein TsaB